MITELANSLCNEFEVFIITLIKTEPFYQIRPQITLLHCSEKTKNRTNPISSTIDGIKRVNVLTKLLKKNKIKLTVGFMTSSNIYAVWASKLCGIPSIISERSNHNINKLSKLLTIIRNLTYVFCDYLVVQTEANKKYYEKHLSATKIIVIPNPIAKSLENQRDMELNIKRENIILNVGSFKKGKGQDLLIKAFSNINPQGWKIIFVGDGPTKIEHQNLAKSLNLEKKIKFAGRQKNIYEFYNKASLFVFTSEHEGFPNALLEALYFGIPTISTNCEHGPADLITDGENGFLVPVGDQKKVEQKILTLISDKTLQKKFRIESMKSTEKYRIEKIVSLWQNYIDKLI